MARPPRATRVIVISDLHLGGDPPRMMSRPGALASFIDRLSAQRDEDLELVIPGDSVDFLALPPHASFTPEPAEACRKLDRVMSAPSPFAPVFDALGRFVDEGHRL